MKLLKMYWSLGSFVWIQALAVDWKVLETLQKLSKVHERLLQSGDSLR